MTYVHTVTVGGVDTVVAVVLLMHHEFVQLGGEVVCSTQVRVPVGVDAIGCNVRALLTIIITVILELPPTLSGRMTMDLAYLAGYINKGCRNTPFTIAPTTIIMSERITRATRGGVNRRYTKFLPFSNLRLDTM
jgi:hypothetical protein